jgi:hypothetical protein
MAKWQPGLPVKVKPTSDLEKLGSLVMKGTLALWEEEMDRYVVVPNLHRSSFHDEYTSLYPAHSDAYGQVLLKRRGCF